MKQPGRHAWVHFLISALIMMGLLTGCAGDTAQRPPDQQTANQQRTTASAPSIEPTPSVAPEGPVSGATTDIPPETPPKDAPPPSNGLEDKLEVHFIDVGQADAILIRQGASAMVIDAGNNADASLVVQYIKNQGVSRLDYVIGTHPHEDHIGGLDAVIREFQIDKVIMPKAAANTKTFEDVLEAIRDKGLKVTAPVPGTQYRLGSAGFTILAPNSASYEDTNNYSVVIRLTFGEKAFLMTGDAEAVSEGEMMDKGFKLQSDVLKAGHHGSTSSTTAAFLDAVDPQVAVISVGQDNSYGHPSPVILKRLQDRGIQIFRTDEDGTVIAVCDGTAIAFAFQKDSTEDTAAKTPSTPPSAPAAPTPAQTSPTAGGVVIQSVDLRQEIVTLKNTSSEDIDLSGWVLVSVKGSQSFTFPPGSIIKAGSTLTIASGDAAGDIKWTNSSIWNNDGDPARLIDAEGTVVSEY